MQTLVLRGFLIHGIFELQTLAQKEGHGYYIWTMYF